MKQVALAAFPNLGDLPENGGAWVGANQANGSTKIIQDDIDGVRELECSIQNADVDQVGARAFHNLPDGRWLTLAPYYGKTVTFKWQAWLDLDDLQEGESKWLTCGLEVKDDTHPNALIQTNITQIENYYYYWLNNGGTGNIPVPMHKWHDVSLTVALSTMNSPYVLQYEHDFIQGIGPTSGKTVAGVAWCLYGNNIKYGLARFRNLSLWIN